MLISYKCNYLWVLSVCFKETRGRLLQIQLCMPYQIPFKLSRELWVQVIFFPMKEASRGSHQKLRHKDLKTEF